MTSVRGRGHSCWERHSVAPSFAPFIASSDFFPLSELGDKLSDQPAGPSRLKPLANSAPAAISISKYSEDNLQQIFKNVLEAQALVPVPALASTPVPALIVYKVPREKLKTRFPDVYCGKSHMDCYNFCQ